MIVEDPWSIAEGCSYPLGVSFNSDMQSWNFSIFSRYAKGLKLLIYKSDDLSNPIFIFDFNPFKHKTHSIWHCAIDKNQIPDAVFYAYRVNGMDSVPAFEFQSFNENKILLDPYAKAVFFPDSFSRVAACGMERNDGKAPLGVLLPETEPFDWQGDTGPRHDFDLIIYETHVRQYTKNPNSGVAPEQQGTFQGLISKIPYLKELGITAVELMPVHQWDPQEGSTWGYMTMNFFSPNHDYAADKTISGAVTEFKTLVRELHKNDIEVIMDVVYNHTTEGDEDGPMYSFKGFDQGAFYMSNGANNRFFSNYAGCGNTMKASNSAVRGLIVDSLRYWVKEMHVDGFRFDIASVFARNADGTFNLTDPPILSEIAMDPLLHDVILIAEPWGPFAYLLGQKFPGVIWRQWNGLYRDQIKQFVKGDSTMVGNAVSRIYGSDDLFPGDSFNAFNSYQSLNYLSSHDGYTLYDCLSYSNNSDKANRNKSWNCGHEGVDDVPDDVMSLRKRLIKNNITLLMISNGTPMFRAGEEFLQTQYGNDNPYNVDDQTTWMDWSRKEKFGDVFRFFKQIIAFRKIHPSIGRSRFWREDVKWFGNEGHIDFSADCRTLAFYLNGNNALYNIVDKDLYVMINNYWEAVEFTFQVPGSWYRVVNTGLDTPNDIIDEDQELIGGNRYLIGYRSIAVFVK